MKSSLAEVLDGRIAVAYGAGEYFERFCDRTGDVFEYFVDDSLAGQARHGVPIRAVASLAEETREICVFLFCRDVATALLTLDSHGLRWGRNVFDAHVFGDGSHRYTDYHLLSSREEIAASPDIEWHQGRDASLEVGKILVQIQRGVEVPKIFLAEGARLTAETLVLSSGSRICGGRGARITVGEGTQIPPDFTLNCSLASTVEVGAGVIFSPHSVVNTASYTSIRIGARSTFGPHLDMYAYAEIEIGEGCMFSSHVFVASGAGHDLVVDSVPKPPKKVVLGDRVWIGWGAQLLAGAELGAGSMAASSSVVNRAFSIRSLVAGVPAKVIAAPISWDRDFRAYKELFHPRRP